MQFLCTRNIMSAGSLLILAELSFSINDSLFEYDTNSIKCPHLAPLFLTQSGVISGSITWTLFLAFCTFLPLRPPFCSSALRIEPTNCWSFCTSAPRRTIYCLALEMVASAIVHIVDSFLVFKLFLSVTSQFTLLLAFFHLITLVTQVHPSEAVKTFS
jgi:hypothetical protein